MATIDDVYNLLVIVDGKIDTLQTAVTAIKAKTDQLAFISGDVVATLDGETVNVSSSSGGVKLAGERFEDFAETSY